MHFVISYTNTQTHIPHAEAFERIFFHSLPSVIQDYVKSIPGSNPTQFSFFRSVKERTKYLVEDLMFEKELKGFIFYEDVGKLHEHIVIKTIVHNND